MALSPVGTSSAVRENSPAQPFELGAVGATLLAVVTLWAAHAAGSAVVQSVVAGLAGVPITVVVVVLALRVARISRSDGRLTRGWQFVAIASSVLIVGDLLLIIEQVLGISRAEGWAQLGYFFYSPLMLCAMVLLPPALSSVGERIKFGLDVATVGGAGAVILWYLVVLPALPAPPAQTDLPTAVRIGYPIADLCLLVGLASVLLRCPPGRRCRSLMVLVVSQTVVLLGDGALAPLASIPGSDVTLLTAMSRVPAGALLLAALLYEQRRLEEAGKENDATPRPIMALPWLAVIAAYAVLLFGVKAGLTTAQLAPLMLGSFCLGVFVLARLILVVRENIALIRERTILAGESRFRALVQHASDVVIIVDADFIITFASPSATRTLGYEVSDMVGISILGVLDRADIVDGARRLREVLGDPERPVTARWRFRRNDGTPVETDTVCTNLMRDEHVRGLVLTARDVSEQCALEAQLRQQAFHDALTGLANRALFQDRVHHALSRRAGEFKTLGVIFIDLDNFKTINDSLGHSTGDLLLKQAAQRLVSCLRSFDTASRLGGDEFAVLVDDTRRYDDVPQVADRITRAFRDPFTVDGREILATASVGVALAMADQTAEGLLRNADLAMYLAKSRGRGQAALFEPSMHAAALDRLQLQSDLRHALERDELDVVYQPVHALDSQRLVGAEALVRWMHPTRGPIQPATFVPVAEDTGLIVPIGRWVMERACHDAARWRALGDDHVHLQVSINLSSRQIPDPGLFADVQQALRKPGLPAQAVVLELTESILLEHTAQAMSLLNRLRSLGVQLAIDDFGTGYSSLSYLHRLPIDILKIDRAFVEPLGTGTGAAKLIRAIVSLGESMSLKTVGEGIESAQQAMHLRALGCDYGQGFLYGMPMLSGELETYVKRSRRTQSSRVAEFSAAAPAV